MNHKMLMTSGYNFEGYTITEYLGVFSGECALGTGFLSSLGAGISDFLGTNSKMYSNKLKEAKSYAMEQLQRQVVAAGGNAIIGLDIDYVSFSSDIMGVITTGTAVKLKDIVTSSENPKSFCYTINLTNNGLPFRASALYVDFLTNDTFSLQLELFHASDCPLRALEADIIFSDILGNKTCFENIIFYGFSYEKKKYLLSSSVTQKFSANILDILTGVSVRIKKYVIGEEIEELEDISISEAIPEPEPDPLSSRHAYIEILSKVEHFERAKEIVDYVKDYNDEHSGIIDQELLDKLEHIVMMEKFYGNHKSEAVKALKEYWGLDE